MSEGLATFDLTGRTAVVTGGSRGLGRHTVLAFAEAGADVLISSRRQESCEELAQEVRDRTGRRAFAHATHVGKWDEVDALAAAAYEHLGRVDILVNNAGMSPFYDRPQDVTEELWRKVLDVNLTGPFRLTALIGERMVADGGGSIINISSTAALRPAPDGLVYAGAKAALNAMTEGLAKAYGPQVRVNALLPGAMRTDVTKAWGDDAVESAVSRIALRRSGEPSEIVGAALLLASSAGSYITGSILRVDGGIP